MQHCNDGTALGDLLLHSLELIRLELGLPGTFTDWNFALRGDCVTDCWLKTVWKYCRDHGIGLYDRHTSLTLARKDDQFLMEAFYRAKYTAADLKKLNECRTFLKVVTLADICTADGKFIVKKNNGRTTPFTASIEI